MLMPVLAFAHHLLLQAIRPGDHAVDATAGNGHDTVWLAQCVGAQGRVYAFDIQAAALTATAQRLQQAELAARVQLIADNHAHMAAHVPAGVAAVAFNFGYLPGGDKSQTTEADTSIAALNSALTLLRPHGLLSAVLYPGHAAGAAEARAVQAWAAALPAQQYSVLHYGWLNRRHAPPFLLALEKRGE